MSRVWRVRLAEQAELDLLEILAWTTEHFGAGQAEFYAETLILAIEALQEGPEILGAVARDDIAPGLCTLHVARRGRQARHLLVFRSVDPQTIDVLRLLHDGMDLGRHVPAINE